MIPQRIGKYILFFAILGQLTHTRYFGNNLRPSCLAELLLDLFFLGLVVLGVFLVRTKKLAA